MPNKYTQIQIHYIFAVNNRESVIMPEWREELYKYITGIVKNRAQYPLAVGGWLDHVHLFVRMTPTMNPSDLMAEVKRSSSKWINEKRFTLGRFSWQEGFGAFSYAHSQVQNVIQYIMNQEDHHRNRTFLEEYVSFLNHFGIEYDKRFLFHEI
jgi:REP element-mobilizing transposase RayT